MTTSRASFVKVIKLEDKIHKETTVYEKAERQSILNKWKQIREEGRDGKVSMEEIVDFGKGILHDAHIKRASIEKEKQRIIKEERQRRLEQIIAGNNRGAILHKQKLINSLKAANSIIQNISNSMIIRQMDMLNTQVDRLVQSGVNTKNLKIYNCIPVSKVINSGYTIRDNALSGTALKELRQWMINRITNADINKFNADPLFEMALRLLRGEIKITEFIGGAAGKPHRKSSVQTDLEKFNLFVIILLLGETKAYYPIKTTSADNKHLAY